MFGPEGPPMSPLFFRLFQSKQSPKENVIVVEESSEPLSIRFCSNEAFPTSGRENYLS